MEIYYSLVFCGLLPEIQTGCHWVTRGTGDLLYIDQYTLKNKTRQKNITMTWIDNKKVYDMDLQTYTIDCLKIYKISDKVIKFITEDKTSWKVELAARGKTLAEVKIQSEIFQGDMLSPLQFDATKLHT